MYPPVNDIWMWKTHIEKRENDDGKTHLKVSRVSLIFFRTKPYYCECHQIHFQQLYMVFNSFQ